MTGVQTCALPISGKVAEARQRAFDAYERAGLPHRRIEDWKYTDLRALMREVLPLAAAPDAAALTRAGAALKLHAIEGARRLVLVDGVFAPNLSETGNPEKGLGIRTLRDQGYPHWTPVLVIASLVVTAVLLALLRKPFGSKRSQKKRHEPPVEVQLFEPAYPTPPLPGQPLVPATKEAANG